MTPKESAFKTPEGEATYLAAYAAAMRRWPVPYEEIEVSSRFGRTHVVASGPKTALPLVLLHGFLTTVLIWLPNVADFSREYRVYAIDLMGHRNRSIPDEPIRSPADFVAWLTATLDDLHLGSVFLLGLSFGAWLGVNFTLAAPQRVNKLVLLSPAASLLPLAMQFNLRAMLTGIFPGRASFDGLMRWLGVRGGPEDPAQQCLLDLMNFGAQHIQPSETLRVMPTVFSDDELRSLQAPVLMLLGANEVIYRAGKALVRARRLIPNIDGELVPRAGHNMSWTEYQIVNQRVSDFLKDP